MSTSSIIANKNYNITVPGWLTNRLKPVSKEEFLQRQESRSDFSLNRIIKIVATGILGVTQVHRTTAPFSKSGIQVAIPFLTSYLCSYIPMVLAQGTTTISPTTIPIPPGPQGDEFQVNTYTTGNQYLPKVAVLLGGGFVVVWQSNDQDGSGAGIYGQRYNASGMKVGSEFQINTHTTNDQEGPSVAALSGGGFVVTWASRDQDGSVLGVYAQRYDNLGVKAGNEFRVNTYITKDQHFSSVAALSDGGFVVTWASDGQDQSFHGIYGQRYDASGMTVRPEFQINTYATNDQRAPSVAPLSGGSFVVTWQSDGQDGSLYGIYGQRYDASIKVGSEFQINNSTTGSQYFPSVAAFSGGGFVVTWVSEAQNGSLYGIYGQMYDPLGAKVGSEFQINTYQINISISTDQRTPSVAVLSGGGFVVTWQSDGQDGPGLGVYGQKYDASGIKVGNEFQINTYTTSSQYTPSVAAFPGGGFVVIWASYDQDGSLYGIYGRLFLENSTSTTQPTTSGLSTALTTTTLTTQQAATTSLANSDPSTMTASETTISRTNTLETSKVTEIKMTPQTADVTNSAASPTVNNIPLIAGLAGGMGALACSLVATVVFILRQRTKNRMNNGEHGMVALSTNQSQISQLSSPNSSEAGTGKNSAKSYDQLPANLGQVNQPDYNSARFDQEKDHYLDLGDRIDQLKKNPRKENYISVDELDNLHQE